MSYRRNKQFLLASQKCYNTGHEKKEYDPCHCTDTCHKTEQCDSCSHSTEESCKCDVCKHRNTPKTITDVLCSLINEQIEVTTPFGMVTGTLLDVERDYIVLLEDNGDQVFVRTEKIESVSPVT